MADTLLTFTTTLITAGTGAAKKTLNAAVAITAGDVMYEDSATTPSQWRKALSDTAAHAVGSAIALNGAAAGQPVVGQTGGQVGLGASGITVALVVGKQYWVGDTAGKISTTEPAAAAYVSYFGYAINSTTLQMNPLATGLAHG